MKKILPFIFTVCVFTLSSCVSSLKVTVDSLNMPVFRKTYLYKLDHLNQLSEKLQTILSKENLSVLREKSLDVVLSFVNNSGFVANEDKGFFTNQFRNIYDSAIQALQSTGEQLLYSIVRVTQNGSEELNLDSCKNEIKSYQDAYFKLKGVFEYFKEVLQDSLRNEDYLLRVSLVFREVDRSIDNHISIFGTSIVADPLASVIAVLPRQYWSKYKSKLQLTNTSTASSDLGQRSNFDLKKSSRYNLTVARTFLGNADIAFKMNSPGEFIVKGVRNDADEAIRTSFKVVAQGIKYMAYSSGIPVTGTSGSVRKSRIPELDSLEENESTLKRLKLKYESANDAFLEVLTSVSHQLNNTSGRSGRSADSISLRAAQNEAIERLKRALIVYKAALSN